MSVGVCPGRRSDRSWCEPLKDLIVKGEPQTLCFAQASGSHLRVCAENLLLRWLLRWLLLIENCYTESEPTPDLELQGQGRTQGRLRLLVGCALQNNGGVHTAMVFSRRILTKNVADARVLSTTSASRRTSRMPLAEAHAEVRALKRYRLPTP